MSESDQPTNKQQADLRMKWVLISSLIVAIFCVIAILAFKELEWQGFLTLSSLLEQLRLALHRS